MDPRDERRRLLTRRAFLRGGSLGLGGLALASLLEPRLFAGPLAGGGGPGAPGVGAAGAGRTGLPGFPNYAPRARRIISLFQSGAPAQQDLFDGKPRMRELHGSELPDSVRRGQRLTGMTSDQTSFPIAASHFGFRRHGQSGAELSELLPHTAAIADEITIVRSMHTEAINHDPATTLCITGSEQPGRPSFGSWISYGLGSENRNLPAFVVLISNGRSSQDSQPLFARLWGTGFLPSDHQGVQFRSGRDPVLYLNDPPGVDAGTRRRMLDTLAELNRQELAAQGDPEIAARIAQYEMSFRMQTSVPELVDLSDEPEETFELYGQDARTPGTYAANCLLARRMAERGVRFIQLYHRGWDQHDNLPGDLRLMCEDTDRASAGLVQDLRRRGLLDDTLVVWGGEFGRTVYCQGPLTATNYGRDHHPRCFTIWLAGGGIRRGHTHGETDDFSYNIVRDPVHVHDLNATLLHCLGIDHEALTYRFSGRDFRLTDVHGEVVEALLA
jgi:hypothetical protein